MKGKQSKSRIVLWAIVAVLIPIMVYLMIDVGNAGEIFQAYNSLKSGITTNINKTTVFLSSYIRTTGDITLGKALGIPDDELEQMQTAGYVSESGISGGREEVSFAAGYTESDWDAALAAKGNPAFFSTRGAYKYVTHGDTTYLVEQQSRGFYSNIKNGTTKTVDGNGCWLFAQVNAANALNMSTYCVADVFSERHNVSVTWNTNTNRWNNPTANSNGELSDGQRVLSEEASVFSYLGVTAESITTSNVSARQCYDMIASSGFNNCVYIVYGHAPGILSNGDDHWLVVVGLTSDGFELLGNYDRGDVVTISQLSSISAPFNRIFKISKR